MAQQLNYTTNDQIAWPRIDLPTYDFTVNFDHENVAMFRLAYDPDKCVPPRQGQLFPQGAPLFGI